MASSSASEVDKPAIVAVCVGSRSGVDNVEDHEDQEGDCDGDPEDFQPESRWARSYVEGGLG